MKRLFFFFTVVLFLLPGCYRKTKRGVEGTGGRTEIRIGDVGGQGGGSVGVGGVGAQAGGEQSAGGQGGEMMAGGEEAFGGQNVGGQGLGGLDVVAPVVGGQGGDGQNTGGQGMGGQNVGGQAGGMGGEGEPARNLRYAPQVWRPEQTKFDLTACGDVPLSPLEFEPVYHPGFDEMDPDTNEPIASHWYARTLGPWMDTVREPYSPTSSDVDVAFSWTAPEAGNYTFRADYFDREFSIPPRLAIRTGCDDYASEFFTFYGDGSRTGRSSGETPTVFLEEGQTVYGLLFWEWRSFGRPVIVEVLKSNPEAAPEIIEVQARRDPDTRRIDVFFRAIDLSQDILNVEFELLEEEGGPAVPIFVDGEETWIPFRGEATFSQGREIFRSGVRLDSIFNNREAVGRAFVYPPPSVVGEPTHVRVKLRDQQGNESNVEEAEVAEGVFVDGLYGVESDLGEPCLLDGECSSLRCKEVDGARQCVEQQALQVDTATAFQTDNQVRFQMNANDPSSSLGVVELQLLNEAGEGEFEEEAFAYADWGHHAITFDYEVRNFLNVHSEGQEDFELGAAWMTGQEESLEDRQVRVYPKLTRVDDFLKNIEGQDNPWLDIPIEPMPMAQLGEACDLFQYQNVCIYGTACMAQDGSEPICEEASIPTIASVRAEWNSTLKVLSLDLEGQGDILGYRLRGFSQIEPDDVMFLGHTELSDGQFQSLGRYPFDRNGNSPSIPNEAWVEVINRQGYSSEPFRFEVVENAQTACELIEPCMEGFECEANPSITGEAICVDESEEVVEPEPNPPELESLTVRFDPQSEMAWVEGAGRTDVKGVRYQVNVSFMDDNDERITSVSFDVEDQEDDPARFSFSTRVFVENSGNRDIQMTSSVLARISHLPPTRISNSANYGDPFDGQFAVIPTVQIGEVCDVRGYENSCALGSRCEVEGMAEPQCVDSSHLCLPNRLNAHINAWEVPDESSEIGVRWQSPPQAAASMYQFEVIESNSYENDCNEGYMYAFTAPDDGDGIVDDRVYQFAFKHWGVEGSDKELSTIRLGLSSSCNAPAANIECENRYDSTTFTQGLEREIVVRRFEDCHDASCSGNFFDGYFNQAVLYQRLEEGETVYLYANQLFRGRSNGLDMFTVSVDLYSAAPEMRVQEEGSHTRATFDSSVRRGQIQVEIEDMGSRSDLVHVLLEYQLLNAEGNPIAFGTLGGGVNPEERWLVPLRQLPKTPLPNGEDPFVANTSFFTPPIAEDRLDGISGYRVWLLSDEGIRSGPIDIQIENPELVQEGRDCDPYGFYNRCPDGLVCMSLQSPNQCAENPDEDDDAEGTRCYEPSDLCPRDTCPADWDEKIIDLNASVEPDGSWLHAETLREEHPRAVEYSLDAYCSVYRTDQHHVYAFTAQEPGRYRARLMSDSTDYAFRLSVRDACMRAETDLGCSLEDSLANPETEERFNTKIYRRQYLDEPFLVQAISIGTHRETRMDLHENQTVYLFVSAYDSLLEREELPYQLMLEKM